MNEVSSEDMKTIAILEKMTAIQGIQLNHVRGLDSDDLIHDMIKCDTLRNGVYANCPHVVCIHLLDSGIPAQEVNECLVLASDLGFDRIVKILLGDRRSDPNYSNCASYRFALRSGHHRVVSTLLGDSRTKNVKELDTTVQPVKKLSPITITIGGVLVTTAFYGWCFYSAIVSNTRAVVDLTTELKRIHKV